MNSTLIDSKAPLTNEKLSFVTHYKDELYLFAFLLIYLATWTLLMAWLPLSMNNADDIEQVVWSRTWQWGYYKHPPLPSLLMYGLSHLFGGPSKGLTAFAALSCNVVALIYMWLLAKQLLPRKLAITAVLITTLISYYSFKAVIFNHNTVSFPFTAALMYYFYCAVRHPERLLMWLLLGVAGGLAMLTKYSAILVLASFFVYLIWQQLWRNPLVIRGLLVSILVFLLVFSPHVMWLVEHDYLPFTYLDTYLDNQLTTLQSRLNVLINFSETQALRLSAMLVAVLLLNRFSQRKLMAVNTLDPSGIHNDRRFLLIMLFTPLILALLPMLLKGSFLSNNWISAFFLPAGIVLVQYFFRQHDETQLLQNTQRLVWGIQVVVLLIFFGGMVLYPTMAGRSVGYNFPSQLLAERVSATWREHQKQPLTIVIANTWLGGNVLLHARPEPILLIDNDTVISPWVNRDDVASCGALVLTSIADKTTPVYADLFKQASVTGSFTLLWGHPPSGQVIEYAWAILSPELNAAPCRLNADAD